MRAASVEVERSAAEVVADATDPTSFHEWQGVVSGDVHTVPVHLSCEA
jgi:hypothetical protein